MRQGRAPSPHWVAVADYARQHPGEWCLVLRDAHSVYRQQVKTGRIAAFRPAGAFDAIIRSGNGLTGNLFIKYTGEGT